MSTTLTKKQYLAQNAQRFSKLTASEKTDRYSQYLAKRKVKKDNNNRKARTAIVVANRKKNPPKIKNTTVKMSDCLLAYIRASTDPFTALPIDPCVPDSIPVPSYKYNVTLMGTMIVGTQGVGVVLFDPILAAASNLGSTGAFSDYPLILSNATYNRANISTDPVDVGTIYTGVNSNSYFDNTSFRAASLRLVAGGVEIIYNGTVLNQAGTITTLQNDGNQPFANPTPTATVMSNPKASVCGNSRDNRCYVTYYPTSSNDFNYVRYDSIMPSQIGVPQLYSHIILVTGAVPGTTFQVKARCYYEAQIPGMGATASESDPIGFPAFQSARTQVTRTPDPTQDTITLIKQTMRNIGKTVSGLAPSVGTAVGTVFGQPTLGNALGSAASEALNVLLN